MNKPVIGITPSHNTENDDISLRPTYLRPLPLQAACLLYSLWRPDLRT